MNILPKKKWHVRTKENVARVRRDEAKAAEEERNKKERAALAEQEHRTKILRERAAARTDAVFGVRASTSAHGPDGISSSVIDQNDDVIDSASGSTQVAVDQTGHVNFFAELEADERKNLGTTNKEYEQEKKQEKEAEEKKIGLLKYLGEGSAEYTKEVPWYQRVPEKPLASSSIPDKKPPVERKQLEGIVGLGAPSRPTTASDTVVTPSDLKRAKRKLKKEKKRLRKEKKRLKKEKKGSKRRRRSSRSSSSSTSESDSDEELPGPPKTDIAQLRAERLRREAEERAKADAVLRKARGLPEPVQAPQTKPTYKQRYNSQFNPEMARQNRPE